MRIAYTRKRVLPPYMLKVECSNICLKGSTFSAINALNTESYKVNLSTSHTLQLIGPRHIHGPVESDSIQLHPSAERSAI